MFAANGVLAKGAAAKGGMAIWPILIGVLVVAAFVVGAVILVRRQRGAQTPAPTGSRPVVDTAASRRAVDKALGQLASQPDQPPVYAVVVGPGRVSLRLTPSVPTAPVPWQVREDGALWDAQNTDFDNAEHGETGFPLLASLGTIDGELALVNLGRAPGIIALTGDPNAFRTLASTILDEIAASTLTITVVGPMPPTTAPANRVRVTGDVHAVVGAPQPQPVNPQATGALMPVDLLRQHLIVVTTSIGSEAMEQLAMRAETSDNTAAVLVIGDVPNAAWRLESRSDGSLDASVLGLQLDAR